VNPDIGLNLGTTAGPVGMGLWLSGRYNFPFLPLAFASADLGLNVRIPLREHLMVFGGGLGFDWNIAKAWSLSPYAKAGYYLTTYGFGHFMFSGGLDLAFTFSPLLSIDLEISERVFWYTDVETALSLGIAYHFPDPSLPILGTSQPDLEKLGATNDSRPARALSPFSFKITPGAEVYAMPFTVPMNVPRGSLGAFFGNLWLSAIYGLPETPAQQLSFDIGISSPYSSDLRFSVVAGYAFAWEILKSLDFTAFIKGGCYIPTSGYPNILTIAGLGLWYYLTPTTSIGLDLSLLTCYPPEFEVSAGIGMSFNLPETRGPPTGREPSPPASSALSAGEQRAGTPYAQESYFAFLSGTAYGLGFGSLQPISRLDVWGSVLVTLPFFPLLYISWDFGGNSLNDFRQMVFPLAFGVGIDWRVLERLNVSPYAKIGSYVSFSGQLDAFYAGGINVSFFWTPTFLGGIDLSARYFQGAYLEAVVALTATFKVAAGKKTASATATRPRVETMPAEEKQLDDKPKLLQNSPATTPEPANKGEATTVAQSGAAIPERAVSPQPAAASAAASATTPQAALAPKAAATVSAPITSSEAPAPAAKQAPAPAQAEPGPSPATAAALAASSAQIQTALKAQQQKAAPPAVATPSAPTQRTGSGVELANFALDPVFPVFLKYYDEHPIGKATIHNWEKLPAENIKVQLTIKGYMTEKKLCTAPQKLAPGEEKPVELYGLFTEEVLKISEGTKVLANISVEYTVNGQAKAQEFIQTVRFYDRNAMTWEDDRRAAAFVTAKNPSVMKFAKLALGRIKDQASKAVNANLKTLIGLQEALRLIGMSYVVDPKSSYAEMSKQKSEVDFLQFPEQTLEYKAGDCDDLSILYCALLESVGVETAFITVPGHIFPAFSLDITAEDARASFLRADQIIFRSDKSWLPFEATEIKGGFLKAWEAGAKLWLENNAKGQAKLYPLHEAWGMYEPVAFTSGTFSPSFPPDEALIAGFKDQTVKFIEREIYERVAKLQAEINKASGKPEPINKLGVLYARYGLSDRAEKEFLRIVAKQEYVPALVNLGNLAYLSAEFKKALGFFERAAKKEPNNAKVLLGTARSNHEMENYGVVREAFAKLKGIDSDLAAQFAYLDLRGEEATRAAEISEVKNVVIWYE
jgi:tetratricopeptide (TPR) repeat protein